MDVFYPQHIFQSPQAAVVFPREKSKTLWTRASSHHDRILEKVISCLFRKEEDFADFKEGNDKKNSSGMRVNGRHVVTKTRRKRNQRKPIVVDSDDDSEPPSKSPSKKTFIEPQAKKI